MSDKVGIQTYLEENKVSVRIDSAATLNLSRFDPHFSKAKLILLGETHGSQLNEVLDINLFKYLYKHHGVRYYLAENGYGMGLRINEYIQTGDTQLLKSIFQQLDGSFSYTNENYDRIVQLRDFNASLPPHAKITYLGIDIEQRTGTGIQAIRRFLVMDTGLYPPSIKGALLQIEYLSSKSFTSAMGFCAYFHQAIQQPRLKPFYVDAFNGHYDEVLLILENIILRNELYRNNSNYLYKRENQIAKNFEFVMNMYPDGVFYGKWGVFHIWKNNVANQNSSFVKRSIAAGHIKSKEVVSIPIFYQDSFYANKNDQYAATAITSMIAPEEIQSNDSSSITFFNLHKATSPFKRKMLFIDGPKGVTTDYFDILIKLRGSKASEKRF